MPGAGSVILSDHVVKNPAALVQAVATHRVTHLTVVPTLLRSLVPYLAPSAHDSRGSTRAQPCPGLISPGESSPSRLAGSSCHNVTCLKPTERQSSASYDTSSTQHRPIVGVALPSDPLSGAESQVALDDDEGHRATGYLSLRVVVSSGEPLTLNLAQSVTPLLPPGCRLLNLYGSTEVSADCTCVDITTHSTRGHDASSGPAPSLPAGNPTKATAVSPEGVVRAATAAPTATSAPATAQHAQRAAQTGQHLSARLPDPVLHGAHTVLPDSAAASMATSRQGVVPASGWPGISQEVGAHSSAPAPFQPPPTHNPQVAVGWPLDGFAVCILAMTTVLQEEKPPGKLAVHSSSCLDSTMQQHKSQHGSPHGLSHAKKRRIGLISGASEAGVSESVDPAERGVARGTGGELVGSCSILEAGVVGEVAVAGTGLALGYHRYRLKLDFEP